MKDSAEKMVYAIGNVLLVHEDALCEDVHHVNGVVYPGIFRRTVVVPREFWRDATVRQMWHLVDVYTNQICYLVYDRPRGLCNVSDKVGIRRQIIVIDEAIKRLFILDGTTDYMAYLAAAKALDSVFYIDVDREDVYARWQKVIVKKEDWEDVVFRKKRDVGTPLKGELDLSISWMRIIETPIVIDVASQPGEG